jgi:hypothetical protein
VYNANQVEAKIGVSHKTKVQLELVQAVKSAINAMLNVDEKKVQ